MYLPFLFLQRGRKNWFNGTSQNFDGTFNRGDGGSSAHLHHLPPNHYVGRIVQDETRGRGDLTKRPRYFEFHPDHRDYIRQFRRSYRNLNDFLTNNNFQTDHQLESQQQQEPRQQQEPEQQQEPQQQQQRQQI